MSRHCAIALSAIAVVALCGFAVALASTSSSSSSTTPSETTELPSWAADIAQRVARANGDATPWDVRFTVTTPDKVAAVTDEVSDDSTSQVIALMMRGEFTMDTARLPRAMEPPAADWIMLVLNPKDEVVEGMAFASGTPNTSALGSMTVTSL
jgi:ABC-type glycerol-3-phosphate transport system substrate-binding protein